MQCSFCFTAESAWEFPAREFAIDGWDFAAGQWAACEECKRLICAGDKQGHLEYCLAQMTKNPQFAIKELAATIELVHDGFWKSRDGEPTEGKGDG